MVRLNPTSGTGYRQMADITAITIRHFSGDHSAFDAAKRQHLTWPDAPGILAGNDPCLVWRSPQEVIALGFRSESLMEVLAALAPGQSETAMATDLSEALVVFELRGPTLDEWLSHLVDATAIPRQTGRVRRCRLMDAAVMLLRFEAQRLWLVADRPIAPYLSNWLTYAHQGAFAATISTPGTT